VPDRVYILLDLPRHLDMFLTPCGAYVATLDEAIGVCMPDPEDYDTCTNAAVEELAATGLEVDPEADLIPLAICEELNLNISQLDPDDEGINWEIRHNDEPLARIVGDDGNYRLDVPGFERNVFYSIESAAIALIDMFDPGAVLLAVVTAQRKVVDRRLMPDH
jgi:hypothetical protein